MHSLSLHSSSIETIPLDLETEIKRIEGLLLQRRDELTTLQEELRQFKAHYTQVVGSRLAELNEIERAVKEAEERALGIEIAEDEEDWDDSDNPQATPTIPVKSSLRKLFWSVAKVFHPDHAGDEKEARRRHSIMAEASRAYREGDVDGLHNLLGDEQLKFYCAGTHAGGDNDPEDLADKLVSLKEELRTVEFGTKRIKLDSLYRLKFSVDEEARQGRDTLAEMEERIKRRIVKARRRLEHFP